MKNATPDLNLYCMIVSEGFFTNIKLMQIELSNDS